MSDWEQGNFQFLPMYKKSKWMFTCLCWSCLRIFEVPAGTFLQGDPICVCGSTHISAAYNARAMMEELQCLGKDKPLTHEGRKIKSWSKTNGATFED